jgi:hypothetical protein
LKTHIFTIFSENKKSLNIFDIQELAIVAVQGLPACSR